MGIFSTSSPFDQDVERATSENNTSEEWGLIMEICDHAGVSAQSSKECLRAILRRLAHPDPHVQVHAATLLDACVANCGRVFHLEVASRDFETEFRRLLARAQPPVAARLRALLLHVTDSSDPNWWKGHNERGEGLFPANFVTEETAVPAEGRRESPEPSQVEPVVPAAAAPARIDEAALDEALA
ncbi:hypothetical protein O3G_MSEX010556, partial [Manduca sexta]